MDKLEFHPLADLFPMMTDEETEALGNDMLEHGQREPIALFEGMILEQESISGLRSQRHRAAIP
jgi:hypothetical protein